MTLSEINCILAKYVFGNSNRVVVFEEKISFEKYICGKNTVILNYVLRKVKLDLQI